MIDPALQLAVRLSLAVLFAVSGFGKARALRHFAAAIAAYQILPARPIRFAAAAFALLELAAAAGFLAPASALAAAALAAALLLIYSAAIAVNLRRGREIDCGCTLSGRRQPLRAVLLARNAVLAAAAGVVLAPCDARALVWLDLYTAGAAVLAATLLYAAAHTALQLPPAS